MKKYFTKWLPVEGGVKDEGLAEYNKSQGLPPNYHPSTHLEIEDKRKKKLFLCSRDIQVGDIVWNGRAGYLVVEDGSEGRPEGNWMHFSSVNSLNFKVIGEISPNAYSYVKEGQEFSEEEVNLQYWKNGDNILGKLDDPYFKGRRVNIAVKGPCGHFH